MKHLAAKGRWTMWIPKWQLDQVATGDTLLLPQPLVTEDQKILYVTIELEEPGGGIYLTAWAKHDQAVQYVQRRSTAADAKARRDARHNPVVGDGPASSPRPFGGDDGL